MAARVSDSSPTMDDLAASQQLRSEIAASLHDQTVTCTDTTPTSPHLTSRMNSERAAKALLPGDEVSGVDGTSPSLTRLAARPKRKKKSIVQRGSAQLQTFACMQPYTQTAPNTQDSHDQRLADDISDQAEDVVVPDSQPAATVSIASASLPLTSSTAIPASVINETSLINSLRKTQFSRLPDSLLGSEIDSSPDTDAAPPRNLRTRRNLQLSKPAPHKKVDSTHTTDNQETDSGVVMMPIARKLKARRSVRTPHSKEPGDPPASQKRQKKLCEDAILEEPFESGKHDFQNDSTHNVLQAPAKVLPLATTPRSRRSRNEPAMDIDTERSPEKNSSKKRTYGGRTRKRRSSELCDWQSSVIRNDGSSPDGYVSSGDKTSGAKSKDVAVEEDDAAGEDVAEEEDVPEEEDVAEEEEVAEKEDDAVEAEVSAEEMTSEKDSAEAEDAYEAANSDTADYVIDRKTAMKKSSKKLSEKGKRKSAKSKEKSRKATDKPGKQPKTMTAIEEALGTVRNLNVSPEKRDKGDFTDDEEERIRRVISAYREHQNLSIDELAYIIQWTPDDIKDIKDASTKQAHTDDAENSAAFWVDVKVSLVENMTSGRSFDALRRHIRSRYHTFKRGCWTKEDDDLLIKLYEKHPRNWKLIATVLERSNTDVHNRWTEYLQHRDARKSGRWTVDEEDQLVKAVNKVAQRDEDSRFHGGYLPRDEYTTREISWPAVATEMGNTRGCVQIIAKWAYLMARETPPTIFVQFHPRDADAKPFPTPTPRVPKRGRPSSAEATLEKTSKHARKQKRRHSRASSPEQSTFVSASDSPTMDKMLWGDKFDLIGALIEGAATVADDVDWDAISAQMKLTWSTRTLQAALEEMLATAPSNDMEQVENSFQERLGFVLDFLEGEHGDELGEHYDPLGDDAEVAAGYARGGTVASGHTLQAKGKRKRKRGGHDDMAGSSRTVQKKKRKTRASTARTLVFKSKEMIEDSDEGEGEDAGAEAGAEAEAEAEVEQEL